MDSTSTSGFDLLAENLVAVFLECNNDLKNLQSMLHQVQEEQGADSLLSALKKQVDSAQQTLERSSSTPLVSGGGKQQQQQLTENEEEEIRRLYPRSRKRKVSDTVSSNSSGSGGLYRHIPPYVSVAQ